MEKIKYYFLCALLLVIFHFILLMIYFEPAISTPDVKGYFTQAKLIATKGIAGFIVLTFVNICLVLYDRFLAKEVIIAPKLR